MNAEGGGRHFRDDTQNITNKSNYVGENERTLLTSWGGPRTATTNRRYSYARSVRTLSTTIRCCTVGQAIGIQALGRAVSAAARR